MIAAQPLPRAALPRRDAALRVVAGPGGVRGAAWWTGPARQGSETMPHYMYQMSYSRDAVKGMISTPSDRRAAAEKLIGAAGGKLHSMFFCFGEYDLVVIAEAPDDKTMAAVALAVGASGTITRGATTKLLTTDEAMEVMTTAGRLTGSYQPPMS